MSRFPQGPKTRGSQRWIQAGVNQPGPRYLDQLLSGQLDGAGDIVWKSPLAEDDYAEYRDQAFLDQIGLSSLTDKLRSFWPGYGPQWDASATRGEDVLLVEAKAHFDEMFSPPSKAGEVSMDKIRRALSEAANSLGARPFSPWETTFYQLANRLAHLYFFHRNGVKAWLVLMNFVGDWDIKGPMTEEEWEAAYKVARHVLGISEQAPLSRYVVHCYPQVSWLASKQQPTAAPAKFRD